MSDFNGKVFILSPEAEEKYNDNDEYAKNWLDASSAEEDRGLFAFYVKPGSGALSIIASEMLKKEKPFLTDDFFSLVLGKSDREKEFIELLKKYRSEVTIESSEVTAEVVENAKTEREALSKLSVELAERAEAAKAERESQAEVALQLGNEITKLTQQLAEAKEAQAATVKENQEALAAAKEERDQLDQQAENVSQLVTNVREIVNTSEGERLGQSEALDARFEKAETERLALEEKLAAANEERLKLTQINSELQKKTTDQAIFLQQMDQRLNNADTSGAEKPLTMDDVNDAIAAKVKTAISEAQGGDSASGESVDGIESINAEAVAEIAQKLINEKFQSSGLPDAPFTRDEIIAIVNQAVSDSPPI